MIFNRKTKAAKNLIFRKVSPRQAPWELLLLADPSHERISTYLADGTCYIALLEEQLVGVFVLVTTSLEKVE